MTETWSDEDDELLACETRSFNSSMERLRMVVRVAILKIKAGWRRGYEQGRK